MRLPVSGCLFVGPVITLPDLGVCNRWMTRSYGLLEFSQGTPLLFAGLLHGKVVKPLRWPLEDQEFVPCTSLYPDGQVIVHVTPHVFVYKRFY